MESLTEIFEEIIKDSDGEGFNDIILDDELVLDVDFNPKLRQEIIDSDPLRKNWN